MKLIKVHNKKTENLFAKISDCDYEKVAKLKWVVLYNYENTGLTVPYANKKKQKIILSRYIMNAPKGLCVDHINHNTLDNRRKNLRICTPLQNGQNKNPELSRSRCGIYGVSKIDGKWIASLGLNNRTLYLGRYNCPVMAKIKRDRMAIKHHGQFASIQTGKEYYI